MDKLKNTTTQHRIVKKTNYTVVSNSIINDTRLDCSSKMVMIYLLSKPDSWIIVSKKVHEALKLGREQCRNSFKKLIDAGYIHRSQNRDKEKGYLTGYDYELFEEPKSAVSSEINQMTGNQLLDNSHIDNTKEQSTKHKEVQIQEEKKDDCTSNFGEPGTIPVKQYITSNDVSEAIKKVQADSNGLSGLEFAKARNKALLALILKAIGQTSVSDSTFKTLLVFFRDLWREPIMLSNRINSYIHEKTCACATTLASSQVAQEPVLEEAPVEEPCYMGIVRKNGFAEYSIPATKLQKMISRANDTDSEIVRLYNLDKDSLLSELNSYTI